MVYKPMDTEAKALQGQARIYNEYSDNWEDKGEISLCHKRRIWQTSIYANV